MYKGSLGLPSGRRDGHARRWAISRQNEEWAAGLDDALARAKRGENAQYDSTEAFFAALDETRMKPEQR